MIAFPSLLSVGVAVVGNNDKEFESLSAGIRSLDVIGLTQLGERNLEMLSRFHEGMTTCFPRRERLKPETIEESLTISAESEFAKTMLECCNQENASTLRDVVAGLDDPSRATFEVFVVLDNTGGRKELAAGAIHCMVRGEDPGKGREPEVYGWIPYLFTMPEYREKEIGKNLESELAERTKACGGKGQFVEIINAPRLSATQLLRELEFYNQGLIIYKQSRGNLPPDEFHLSCVRKGKAPFKLRELESVMPDLLRADGQEIFSPDSRRRFLARCGYDLVDMQYARVGFDMPYCLCYRALQSADEDKPRTLPKSEVMTAIKSSFFGHDHPIRDLAFQRMQAGNLDRQGFELKPLV